MTAFLRRLLSIVRRRPQAATAMFDHDAAIRHSRKHGKRNAEILGRNLAGVFRMLEEDARRERRRTGNAD